ncbi:Hypothetical protein ORPV_320 [Orpheovirus IHUMI-LCC2]|uniref:Uncharacterized protein n=1 Tax=Orpheovirus IHUMI-LCC2 TaxID=2023057 RepID=A0A2I2L3W9_9VIRU|nr:Hypothetical protein ORPV_320 [Orpheovirus IHUMI-LCC2]SNW62224.1 Hypothetical protein ORPV_320 [Orpheovirus IHUMI-LCC2]
MPTLNYTLSLGNVYEKGEDFEYDYIGETVRENIEDVLIVISKQCEFTYTLQQEGRDTLCGTYLLNSDEDGYDYIGESLREDLEDKLDYSKDFKLTYSLTY